MDPLNVDQYISRDYYNGLDNSCREVYMRGVRDALAEMETRVVEIIGQLHLWEFYMDVMFVGMRFRGGHTFQAGDDVVLEREYFNEFDAYAVKVFVRKDGVLEHVAYVASEDARALRRYYGFERAQLQFIQHYAQSVRYRVIFPRG